MTPYTDPAIRPALDAYMQMVMAHSGEGPVMTPAEKVEACAVMCQAPPYYAQYFLTQLVLIHDPDAHEQYNAARKADWVAAIVQRGGDADTLDALERANWRVVMGRDPGPSLEG